MVATTMKPGSSLVDRPGPSLDAPGARSGGKSPLKQKLASLDFEAAQAALEPQSGGAPGGGEPPGRGGGGPLGHYAPHSGPPKALPPIPMASQEDFRAREMARRAREGKFPLPKDAGPLPELIAEVKALTLEMEGDRSVVDALDAFRLGIEPDDPAALASYRSMRDTTDPVGAQRHLYLGHKLGARRIAAAELRALAAGPVAPSYVHVRAELQAQIEALLGDIELAESTIDGYKDALTRAWRPLGPGAEADHGLPHVAPPDAITDEVPPEMSQLKKHEVDRSELSEDLETTTPPRDDVMSRWEHRERDEAVKEQVRGVQSEHHLEVTGGPWRHDEDRSDVLSPMQQGLKGLPHRHVRYNDYLARLNYQDVREGIPATVRAAHEGSTMHVYRCGRDHADELPDTARHETGHAVHAKHPALLDELTKVGGWSMKTFPSVKRELAGNGLSPGEIETFLGRIGADKERVARGRVYKLDRDNPAHVWCRPEGTLPDDEHLQPRLDHYHAKNPQPGEDERTKDNEASNAWDYSRTNPLEHFAELYMKMTSDPGTLHTELVERAPRLGGGQGNARGGAPEGALRLARPPVEPRPQRRARHRLRRGGRAGAPEERRAHPRRGAARGAHRALRGARADGRDARADRGAAAGFDAIEAMVGSCARRA
ncbi:MAG: hypothetical protein U1F43_05065 [Myxococcota bacterium]